MINRAGLDPMAPHARPPWCFGKSRWIGLRLVKDIDQLHTRAIKIRLIGRDAKLLEALATRRNVPVAVLARQIIVQSLENSQTEASKS